jgi:hypothetical protein
MPNIDPAFFTGMWDREMGAPPSRSQKKNPPEAGCNSPSGGTGRPALSRKWMIFLVAHGISCWRGQQDRFSSDSFCNR